jgi:hypothetical protein
MRLEMEKDGQRASKASQVAVVLLGGGGACPLRQVEACLQLSLSGSDPELKGSMPAALEFSTGKSFGQSELL